MPEPMPKKRTKLTYSKSGVSRLRASRAVSLIKQSAGISFSRNVLSPIGGFSSLFRFPANAYREPVLVSGTDGVGTKILVAQKLRKVENLGIDLVAMSVNDVLTCGARPLFFLDYIACGEIKPAMIDKLIKGMAKGCQMADCALVGGELAEMPGLYKRNEFDLAGFCVGVVEGKKIVDGARVREGDVIIGLPSSGLHSNGFSLVRKVFSLRNSENLEQTIPVLGCSLTDELLKPTIIYVRQAHKLLSRFPINAMAHITGGGLMENVPRVLPSGLQAVFWKGAWDVPPIFRLIQEKGNVPENEMYKTFNMGIGFVLVVRPDVAKNILKSENDAVLCGMISKGKVGVTFIPRE